MAHVDFTDEWRICLYLVNRQVIRMFMFKLRHYLAENVSYSP